MPENNKSTRHQSSLHYCNIAFALGSVHKLLLQEEVGRWSKNVDFLSRFVRQGSKKVKNIIVVFERFIRNRQFNNYVDKMSWVGAILGKKTT